MSEPQENDELMVQAQDMIRRLQVLLRDSEQSMQRKIMDPSCDGAELPDSDHPSAQLSKLPSND